MTSPPAQDDRRAILRWLSEMGAADPLQETAADRRAASAAPLPEPPETPELPEAPELPKAAAMVQPSKLPPHPSPAAISVAPRQTAVVVPPDEALKSARELAAAATTLEQLQQSLAAFEGCQLKKTAGQLVFADGNPAADLMLIGEAPGRDEDHQGLPFVGRSGQLLNAMLQAIQIDRHNCYISNVIPWRPPGNRTPTPQETEICRPFIERHIELAAPRIIVCLGGAAAKTLLGTTTGILRLRGNWHQAQIGGHKASVIATLHPAYLLRQPAQKALAWRDLQMIAEKLAQPAERA